MAELTQEVGPLVAFLRSHQNEIARAWADAVYALSDACRQSLDSGELRTCLADGVQAMVETIATGSGDAMEAYLQGSLGACRRAGLDISQAIQVFMLLQDATLLVIEQAHEPGLDMVSWAADRLRSHTRSLVSRFAQLGVEAAALQIPRRDSSWPDVIQTNADLLQLDEVLQSIVENGAQAFGLECVLYRIDRLNGTLIRRASSKRRGDDARNIPYRAELSATAAALMDGMRGHDKPIACHRDGARDAREILRLLGYGSALIVPIRADSLHFALVIGDSSDEARRFAQEDIELAESMASAATLAMSNAQFCREAYQRLAECESLHPVTMALLQGLTLGEVLETVCCEAQQLSGAAGSAILLVDDSETLRVAYSAGSPSPALDLLPFRGSFAGRAMDRGELLLVDDIDRLAQAYHGVPDLEALLVVPLSVHGSMIGALDLVNKPGGFSKEDMRIAGLFADQASIAIEHAQLHERSAQLAVIEERQRLARELHDSVSQALYSITLYAEATDKAMAAGKREVVVQNLHELQDMAWEAMIDMRMLISELHPPALEEEGLVAALQSRLAAVEARAGLETEIQAKGEAPLPLSIREELYWIAKEALNNVVKHAQARRVVVSLELEDDHACLQVQDDGVGFDPGVAGQSGGMGLQGMKERAGHVNGTLEIHSVPGNGTTVTVRVANPASGR